jgi:hypothetical protein
MGRKVDLVEAAERMETEYAQALNLYRSGDAPALEPALSAAVETLFLSKTQSFREALVGCCLAKLADPAIDVRLPYAGQGENAFQGRDIDENVINPFFQSNQIPSSKGPYLAAIRRDFKYIPEKRKGVLHKSGYDAFLLLIDFLGNASADEVALLLRVLLWKFVQLREQGNIELTRLQRLSLAQHEMLIRGLLQVPSGGLLPVLLSVAMFQTLRDCFSLKWGVDWQGINAADRASGVGGDITIRSDDKTILAVEITERVIDRSRVVSTFNTKIAAHGLEDYLFLFSDAPPEPEARVTAQQYFSQGHDVSFLPVASWLVSCLGTIGPSCRRMFSERMLTLLEQPTVPAHVKIAWNDQHTALLQ